MGQIHVLKTPKKNQNWFLIGDVHASYMNPACFSILLQHAKTFPLEHRNLIINGDLCELAFMMKKSAEFNIWKDRKDGVDGFFLPMFEDEMRVVNSFLDKIQEVFNHVIFIHGNHDQPRCDEYVEKYCPVAYRPNFEINKALKLERRNIGAIPYNDYLNFGKVFITHGEYHGPSGLLKHYMTVGSHNVIISHIHKSEKKPFIVMGDTRSAWSLPSFADLAPGYLKNRNNDWENGYGQLLMRPDGNFNFTTHLVIDNQLTLPSLEHFKG